MNAVPDEASVPVQENTMQTQHLLEHVEHRANDAITRYVESVVTSRNPVTPDQLTSAIALVANLVAPKWELSLRGAVQAITPIMTRLMPPTVIGRPGVTRRVG